MELKTNVLYYGDNLEILRTHLPDESVDLIYLDPPFNSKRSYNILFKESTGVGSEAQIEAFEDAWRWAPAATATYEEVITGPHQEVARMLRAMVDGLGHNDVTAYLSMMAARLVELRRVLKPTGSIYLHCDPTASHYLKVLMDGIWGPGNFRNEIVWKRSSAHSDSRQGARHYGRVSDTLLFYSKSAAVTWNQQYVPYDPNYVAQNYKRRDPDGRVYRISDIQGPGGAAKGNPRYEFLGVTRYWRYSKERMQQLYDEGRIIQTRPGAVPQYKRYLDEMPGTPVQNVWTDVSVINNRSKEMLGYATQKPLALLERIISTSSDPGDVVLDPFCGCGTAVHAAQKLERRWIGIDVTHLAIGLIRRRMLDAFPGIDIEVIGEPMDLTGATDLADRDKYQFQWWALDRLGAQPVGGKKKKGADEGIDGVIPILTGGSSEKPEWGVAIVSVKGGAKVTVSMIRDLVGVIDNAGEPIGIFLTLAPPTSAMVKEAAKAGLWHSALWQRKFPRIQIMTVDEMLRGKQLDVPWSKTPFAVAPTEKADGKQENLL